MRYLLLSVVLPALIGCSHILPEQIPTPSNNNVSAIVSDIDGTLTPNVALFWEMRPDAANAISALSNKEYKIIYITARHPLFQSGLPNWLRENGFPEGTLHVAQTCEERDNPEIFKARILNQYVENGWQLEYAYGDSSTDFIAYAEAGIPKDRVFALKRKGSNDCQDGIYQVCIDGWSEYLSYISKEVPGKK